MSKLDEKESYLCPEIVCDTVKERLARLGIVLSDNTYASLWDDVMPITEEEKYAERRRLNLIKG